MTPLREKLEKMLTDKDGDLELSFEHTKRVTNPTIPMVAPGYAPTWEAGRACGFHAGLATERSRTKPIHDALLDVVEAAETELRVFHDGGTESEQTHAMITLQEALRKLAALVERKQE